MQKVMGKLISTTETAKILNCTVANVSYLLRAGIIPGQKKRLWRIDETAVKAYAKQYKRIADTADKISDLERQLAEKEKEMRRQIKELKLRLHIIEPCISALQTLFADSKRQRPFDIAECLKNGIKPVAKQKAKEWKMGATMSAQIYISKQIKRFLYELNKAGNFADLKTENEILRNRLNIAEMAIKKHVRENPHWLNNINESKIEFTWPIARLDLSVRAQNCLSVADITTIGELCCWNRSELMRIRNFGKKCVDEIETALGALQLQLKTE